MSNPIPFASSWKNERRLSAQKEEEEEEKQQQLELIFISRKNCVNKRQPKRGHDDERGDNYLKAKILCTVRYGAGDTVSRRGSRQYSVFQFGRAGFLMEPAQFRQHPSRQTIFGICSGTKVSR